MNDVTLMLLVLGAAVILAVLVYNMYQENRYRQQIRQQFGHADQDALLDGQQQQVRDGQGHLQHPFSPAQAAEADVSEADGDVADALIGEDGAQTVAAPSPLNMTDAADAVLQPAPQRAPRFDFAKIPLPQASQTAVAAKQKLLLDLADLAKVELPWFDKRFDYMAYVSLHEPQELHALPRLSNRHRFRVAGCTMDGRFQLAEPIPSVYYQGFVMGLQAISRTGLVTTPELEQFGQHANDFAKQMNGGLLLTDVAEFMHTARPLDELCARVDQTIGIHLVSRGSISGIELRAAVEHVGFELSHDGAFYFNDAQGEPLYSIVTLDNTPFTGPLLSSQSYRGFTMLFDMPHVPPGEKVFNQFMDLAVKLSSTLSLDLVGDNLEELSTQWLKELRRYVLARQDEMKAIDLIPGEELAKRLFS